MELSVNVRDTSYIDYHDEEAVIQLSLYDFSRDQKNSLKFDL